MSATKKSTKSSTAKKAAAPNHPPWADMIKVNYNFLVIMFARISGMQDCDLLPLRGSVTSAPVFRGGYLTFYMRWL